MIPATSLQGARQTGDDCIYLIRFSGPTGTYTGILPLTNRNLHPVSQVQIYEGLAGQYPRIHPEPEALILAYAGPCELDLLIANGTQTEPTHFIDTPTGHCRIWEINGGARFSSFERAFKTAGSLYLMLEQGQPAISPSQLFAMHLPFFYLNVQQLQAAPACLSMDRTTLAKVLTDQFLTLYSSKSRPLNMQTNHLALFSDGCWHLLDLSQSVFKPRTGNRVILPCNNSSQTKAWEIISRLFDAPGAKLHQDVEQLHDHLTIRPELEGLIFQRPSISGLIRAAYTGQLLPPGIGRICNIINLSVITSLTRPYAKHSDISISNR